MKTNNENMRFSRLALAMQAALLAMFALPAYAADSADDEVAALKRPSNYVEVGLQDVTRTSAKFGEFNGLNKAGVNTVANFNIMGGDAYKPFGEAGTIRWGVFGTDIGTNSHAVGGSLSNQGKWDISFGYDQLRHNISDTYQTPYLGGVGGNVFVLPAGFGPIANTNPPPPQGPAGNLTVAKQAAFHNLDISANRRNTNLGAGVVLNDEWSLKVDYNQQVQSGAKLIGFGSMLNAAVVGVAGEGVSILPMPTSYKTETVNVALNWLGDHANATGAYYGSFFRDTYNSVKYQPFTGTSPVANQTMSTVPNNDFHQFSLNGGYAFTSTTKLTGGLSYAKNTQNDPYAGTYDSYAMLAVPPVASLNGNIVTTHADVKLVDQTTKALTLSGSLKFDERNNKTASNFYYINAISGSPGNSANVPNAPVSNKKTQLELAGDYRIDKDQLFRLAYNYEEVKRWCNQYGVSAPKLIPGLLSLNSYPAGTNCVVAIASKDDKISAAYKLKASEYIHLNVGYSYSQRKTTSDPNAITPRISTNGNPNPAAAVGTLIQGMNAGDFRGFYPFFDASRKQQMLKGGVNWQTNEKLSLGFGGKYTDDKYDSQYGVQKGNSWSVNLDSDYTYSENGSFSFYLTQEHKQRDMTDLQRSPFVAAGVASVTALNIPSGATWSDRQKDEDTTIGLGAKQNGLMGGKFDLTSDLSYTMGRTGYTTVLNYAGKTTGGLTCASPQILSCGNLPIIKNDVIQLKLTGKYKVSKSSEVKVGYLYQQMRSTDYYYNGLQTGFTSNTMLPTNQQAPNYRVNVIAASYSYLF